MAAINLKPNLYDRLLAAGATALCLVVALAVFKGQSEWNRVPAVVWAHLGTIMLALVLTPVQLLRQRGDRLHRQLGWVWASAMVTTALLSFGVGIVGHAGFSPIYLLSVLTLVGVPRLVWQARTHQIAEHRRSVRIVVTFALLIAGFFTFPFGRLLGTWLFG